MGQSLELIRGVRILNPSPVDAKFFNQANQPYTDVAQVLSELQPETIRHQGMFVFVDGLGLHWFENGTTDADLVPYTQGTVVNDTDDVPEGSNNLYFTNTRVSNNSDVQANSSARHSHPNKTLLDSYDQTNVDIIGAINHSGLTTGNPHNVTALEVGVDKTYIDGLGIDASTVNGKSSTDFIEITEKGSNNGVAELDNGGKVPISQLPSFVSDVEEYNTLSSFPVVGEDGIIYIAEDTNLTYRWTGSTYVEISPSIALGETSSTAYRGDRGKIAYDHSQLTTGNPHNVTKSEVGLGNVPNTDFTSAVQANSAKRSYPLADENKLAGIEAGAQVNVKTDWAESNPSSDKFLENKPDQINFSIYNQNSSDEVVVNNTTSTNIIAATTGATTLPSYNLDDSFIGKLFGTFDNSNQASVVRFHFIIGNRTYNTAIDVGASTNILPVSIDYTINFPINREAHITGVVMIGADSEIIDIQLTGTNNTITGLNYMLEAELELGELKSKSSYLHRNYN